MPNAQVVAVCEVDAQRLQEARKLAGIDQRSCYGDFRELLARRGYRRGDGGHAGPLARADLHRGGPGGQGRVLREAADADDSGRPRCWPTR